MRDIETARKIALLLMHLKVALGSPQKGSRKRHSRTHSAEDLASALNVVLGAAVYGRENIDAAIRMHNWPSSEDQKRLLTAIDSLSAARDLGIRASEPVSEAIEAQYSEDLPAAFRRRPTEIAFEGDAIGELTHILSGLWRFYYASPINRDGEPKPEIRSFPAIFGVSDQSSTSVRLTMLSNSNNWLGTAFSNDAHLHLIVNAHARNETASFLTNTPNKRHRIIAGLGLPIRRRSFGMQPVFATLVFGRQWSRETGTQPTWRSDAERNQILEIIQTIARNSVVSETHYDLVRQAFSATLTGFDALQAFDRELFQYLSATTINGRSATEGFQSLFFRWPQ